MTAHRWGDVRRRKLSPSQLEENARSVKQKILELNLRALLELTGKSQADFAKAADTAHPKFSRAENREALRFSALKRHVEALGGELEVFAVFDDKRVKLKGV